MVRTLGDKFFLMLTEWVPMNIPAIQMAEMLVAHSEKFNSPLPELRSNTDRIAAIPA